MKRPVSLFCVFLILFQVFLPGFAWALTSGPTAPEATSFEPVDTTDMVNMATGDLAYNIPLLEVPGPAGGYPLSLSYHAGIQPGEDASWVGLGWTLNPGAVIRNVNGFADDQKDVTDVTRYYWDGGETHTFTVGITVGAVGTPGSVSVGLSYSQDTFQGSGFGASIGIGSKEAGFSLGVDRNGNGSVSGHFGGISAQSNFESVNASANVGNIGIQTDFKTVNASASAGVPGPYGLSTGVAITTGKNGTYVNAKAVGISVSSLKSGRLSTSSTGFSISVPILPVLSISLGYDKQRYWIDETREVSINGALNFPQNASENSSTWMKDHDYDVWLLADPTDLSNNLNLDPNLSIGGTFPAYDNYSVHAQGVNGSMQPFYYQKYLSKKHTYDLDQQGDPIYSSINYSLGTDPKPAEFRFINDFSNRYEYDPASIGQSSGSTPLSFAWSGSPVVGEAGNETLVGNNLPGSRKIVTLTNAEIINNSSKILTSGFIETVSSGFDRATLTSPDYSSLIGAFVITNESGAKYHFALPAFSSNEYFYSENTEVVETFNEYTKKAPYAYTWYLTAVTGPDYIDRGPSGNADGVLNEYDWGYWVEFEYGKWTDSYAWRNPGAGMHKDLDTKFSNFSEGIKELYYLDAIRTKTHTALFVKDIREDGRSSNYFLRNKIFGKTILAPESKTGGYTSTNAVCNCSDENYTGTLNYTAKPTSALKLEEVLLVDNKELANYSWNKSYGTEYALNHGPYNWNVTEINPGLQTCDYSAVSFNQHLYQNVLDVHDLSNAFVDLKSKALRVIDFDTNYSLVPETPNNNSSSALNTGKLSLMGIEFMGKGGASLLPGMHFNYELETQDKKSGSGTLTLDPSGFNNYTLSQSNSGLVAGDLIRLTNQPQNIYGSVLKVIGSTVAIRLIGKIMPPASATVNWVTTKNPPYHEKGNDMWGLYKSDYTPYVNNENLERVTTNRSSKSLDVWSLRSVTTSLGSVIKIGYEPDQYATSFYNKNVSLPLSMGTMVDPAYDPNNDPENGEFPNQWPRKVVLEASIYDDSDINFSQLYNVGATVDLVAVYTTNPNINAPCDVSNVSSGVVLEVSSSNIKIICNQIAHNNDNTYYGGRMFLKKDGETKGGGLRVRSISIEDPASFKKRSTEYEYIGGTTSYEPFKLEQAVLNAPECALAIYRGLLNQPIQELVALGSFVPSPGVLYSKVKVRGSVTDAAGITSQLDSYSEYDFQVYNDDMIELIAGTPTQTVLSSAVQHPDIGGIFYDKIVSRQVTVKDFSTQLGSLKRIAYYDKSGVLISETRNNYLFDQSGDYETNLNQFNKQGLIEETFAEARYVLEHSLVNVDDGIFTLKGVVSKIEQFPAVQTGQTNINYKTGVRSESKTLAFDFLSGQPVKTLSNDIYGNTYLTQTQPAYRVYTGMKNANMLTQEAGTTIFKVSPANPDTKLGLVSASVQTWDDDHEMITGGSTYDYSLHHIWRKKASFSWKGDDWPLNADGTYNKEGFSQFDAWSTGVPASPQWQKQGEVTLYSVNSQALEARDINDNYAATVLSSDLTEVYATVANARYSEFAFSGAEDDALPNGTYSGGVLKRDGTEVFQLNENDKVTTHTGRKALRLNSTGTKAFEYITQAKANKNYVANVWVNSLDGKIKYSVNDVTSSNVGSASVSKKAGNWYLITLNIESQPQDYNLKVWCETTGGACSFDDFRVHPINAPMTSYVYNQWGELSHILDNNNLYTEYRYDNMGRLVSSHKETLHQGGVFAQNYGVDGIVKVNEVEYNYGVNNSIATGPRLDVTLNKDINGSTATYTATVDFGNPPYTYTWYQNNVMMSQVNNTVDVTSTYVTSETCPYTISCVVQDARGVKNLYAYGGVDDLTVSKNFSNLGYEDVPMTFSVTVNGTCGPYTKEWKVGLAAGTQATVGGNTLDLTYTFETCNTYKVICIVKALNGNSAVTVEETVYIEGEGCDPR